MVKKEATKDATSELSNFTTRTSPSQRPQLMVVPPKVTTRASHRCRITRESSAEARLVFNRMERNGLQPTSDGLQPNRNGEVNC